MPNRTKRNAMERKCLSPMAKILYRNHPPSVMRMITELERSNKSKPSQKSDS